MWYCKTKKNQTNKNYNNNNKKLKKKFATTTSKPDEYVSIPNSRICLSSGIIIILPTMSKTIYIFTIYSIKSKERFCAPSM